MIIICPLDPIGTFMFSKNVSNRDGSHEHVPLGGGWNWDAPRQSDNPPSSLVSIQLSRLVNDYHARWDIFWIDHDDSVDSIYLSWSKNSKTFTSVYHFYQMMIKWWWLGFWVGFLDCETQNISPGHSWNDDGTVRSTTSQFFTAEGSLVMRSGTDFTSRGGNSHLFCPV